MRLALVLTTLMMLTACNSVKFSPTETQTKQDDPSVVPPTPVAPNPGNPNPVTPLCLAGETTWKPAGNGQARCADPCWDGSYLQCSTTLEKELVCDPASGLVETGRTRVASMGQAIGACPIRACDPDQVKWVPGGEGQARCADACWDGSYLQCRTQLEKQLVCKDPHAGLTESGLTRVASVGSPIGSCPQKPLPPSEKTVSETFTSPGPGKADILVILDTSGSMSPDLNKLSKRFKSLTKSLGDVDWQVAVTNSALGDGFWDSGAMNGHFMEFQDHPKKLRIMKSSDSSVDYYFQRTVGTEDNVMIGGPGAECKYQPFCQGFTNPQPIATMMKAIDERNSASNKGFFRKDAWLVPLMISDADEDERGGANATKPETAINYFKSVLGNSMKGLLGFGIIIKPGDEACLRDNNRLFGGSGLAGKYGTFVNDFTRKTGGLAMSICDADFSSGLAQVSDRVREKMSFIRIAQEPVDGVIKVVTSPAVAGLTWTRQGLKISFNKPLPVNTKVTVSYKVKGN